MQQQVLAFLLFLAATRSENLYCVTSGQTSSGVWTAFLQNVDSTKGTLTLIKDISALGGVTGGHVFRWLSFGKSFSLVTVDQNTTDNYFYELSTSGDVVRKYATGLVLLSTEVASNASVFVTTILYQQDAIISLQPPQYSSAIPEILLGKTMGQLPIGGSAFSDGIMWIPINDNLDNAAKIIGYELSSNTTISYALPAQLGSILGIEAASSKLLYLLTFSTSNFVVQWYSITLTENSAVPKLLTSFNSSYPASSGATAISNSGTNLFTAVGNESGDRWFVATLNLENLQVTYSPPVNQMIVSLLTSN